MNGPDWQSTRPQIADFDNSVGQQQRDNSGRAGRFRCIAVALHRERTPGLFARNRNHWHSSWLASASIESRAQCKLLPQWKRACLKATGALADPRRAERPSVANGLNGQTNPSAQLWKSSYQLSASGITFALSPHPDKDMFLLQSARHDVSSIARHCQMAVAIPFISENSIASFKNLKEPATANE